MPGQRSEHHHSLPPTNFATAPALKDSTIVRDRPSPSRAWCVLQLSVITIVSNVACINFGLSQGKNRSGVGQKELNRADKYLVAGPCQKGYTDSADTTLHHAMQ